MVEIHASHFLWQVYSVYDIGAYGPSIASIQHFLSNPAVFTVSIYMLMTLLFVINPKVWTLLNDNYMYNPRARSSEGYIHVGSTLPVRLPVRPSVRPSVCLQIRGRPVIYFCFEIGLPYEAHRFITMRRCVEYNLDCNTTLTFDLKVKLKGFLTNLRVWSVTFFALTLAYHIWYMGVSPWDNVNVHSWSWYNIDTKLTCTQIQTYKFFDMSFFLTHNFCLISYWYTIFGILTFTIRGCVV